MGCGKVRITKKAQKWRYRCPNGHTSWEMANDHMWCRACANQLDVNPELRELYDQRSGKTIPREAIVLKA